MKIKKIGLFLGGIVLMLGLAGCSSTQKGAAIGGGAGAIIGGLATNSVAGAAIGGVGGALVGGAIGHGQR